MFLVGQFDYFFLAMTFVQLLLTAFVVMGIWQHRGWAMKLQWIITLPLLIWIFFFSDISTPYEKWTEADRVYLLPIIAITVSSIFYTMAYIKQRRAERSVLTNN